MRGSSKNVRGIGIECQGRIIQVLGRKDQELMGECMIELMVMMFSLLLLAAQYSFMKQVIVQNLAVASLWLLSNIVVQCCIRRKPEINYSRKVTLTSGGKNHHRREICKISITLVVIFIVVIVVKLYDVAVFFLYLIMLFTT